MQKKVKNWKWRIYKAGMTQKEFCEWFGLSEGQLSDWLNGRKEPKKTSVDKIESHLKTLGV